MAVRRSVSGPFFWGKFISEHQYLPLAAHCLDVAWFSLICGSTASVSGRASKLLHDQLDRLAVLAMLHDIGKANLGFQNKVLDPKAPKAGHERVGRTLDKLIC